MKHASSFNPINTMSSSNTSTNHIPFWDAFKFWLRLGFISFGGPAGQIAIMHQELVEKRHWISERRFLHALNFCMLLPGPEAQQLATYIGWLMHRSLGGIVAGVLFVAPSLFILIALSWIYISYGEVPIVAGLFYGIKPAITAVIIHAAYRIGSRAIKNSVLFTISVTAFLSIFIFKIPFPIIVIGAAIIGFIGGRIIPDKFSQHGGHSSEHKSFGPAVIDDLTPVPSHAIFRLSKLISAITIGLILWMIPMALLNYYYGWDHTLTQMGWFFTKAALVTFGGAYAVLPYVYQGAIDHYAWLTPTQMIDGLALGETTPGPLIMVVAFVAFLGGYINELFGPQQLFLAGTVAAILVTWFTFLPSFLFIFAGGPFIETTHGNLKFTAPLTAITAAVVGVIINLALFFGYHVLWPAGFAGQFDWISAIITVAATSALFYWKINLMTVIAACGLAGLIIKTVLF